MERCPVFMTIRDEMADTNGYHRHVLCPHYETCLDEAIAKNLSFDCSQCIYRKRNVTIHVIHSGYSSPFDLEKVLRKA